MIPLPNADEVNQNNVVEVVKQMLFSLQDVSDSTGSTGVALYAEIKALRVSVQNLEKKLDKKTDALAGQLAEQTSLLKIIAKNTKK